jgi:sulfide:quinone oxidoreductase
MDKTIQTQDGSWLRVDYLVIAPGPELAFDEVDGLGPEGFTNSICHIDRA